MSWNYPKGGSGSGNSIAFKFSTPRSGDYTLNNTGSPIAAVIDTATDITLKAAPGDVIEVQLTGLLGNSAVEVYLDVVSIVANTAVNSWATGSAPGSAGFVYGPASVYTNVNGIMKKTIVSGDIASGNVLLRAVYRTIQASNKTLYNNASNPFQFAAVNLGPSA